MPSSKKSVKVRPFSILRPSVPVPLNPVQKDRGRQVDSHHATMRTFAEHCPEKYAQLVQGYNVLAEFCTAFQVTVFPVTPVKVALCLARFLPNSRVGEFLRRNILPAPVSPCPSSFLPSFRSLSRERRSTRQPCWRCSTRSGSQRSLRKITGLVSNASRKPQISTL